MKLRLQYKDDDARDHLVPLAEQAIDVIEALRKLTGRTPYLFLNQRHAHRPARENAIGYLLNRAGHHHRHVPHGWRATFSTVMNERYEHDRHIIDLMLAHVPKNSVEGAYNRAEHLERRIELAQAWADLIMADQMPIKDLISPRRLPVPARDDGKDLIQASISDCNQRTLFGPRLRGTGEVPSAMRRYMVELPSPVFSFTSRSRNRRSSVYPVIRTSRSRGFSALPVRSRSEVGCIASKRVRMSATQTP
jgi:hypothetical protein